MPPAYNPFVESRLRQIPYTSTHGFLDRYTFSVNTANLVSGSCWTAPAKKQRLKNLEREEGRNGFFVWDAKIQKGFRGKKNMIRINYDVTATSVRV